MTTATAITTPAAVPTMTEDQKFLFDLRGWILLPAILTEDQIRGCKEHLLATGADPPKLPLHERNSYSGPCQELLDHPALLPILREIVGPDLMDPVWTNVETHDQHAERKRQGSAYGFRCDNSFHMIRRTGQSVAFSPHNGGPIMGPSHHYQFVNGHIFSPSTRVVWELNAVKKGGGGTPLLSGSHKSHYNVPGSFLDRSAPGWETYECPAGSMIVFTENCCHGSDPWTDPTQPRIAIFNHYMHYGMRFHRSPPPPEAIEAMPPMRRTLFRDVWMFEHDGGRFVGNTYYAADNRAHAREF